MTRSIPRGTPLVTLAESHPKKSDLEISWYLEPIHISTWGAVTYLALLGTVFFLVQSPGTAQQSTVHTPTKHFCWATFIHKYWKSNALWPAANAKLRILLGSLIYCLIAWLLDWLLCLWTPYSKSFRHALLGLPKKKLLLLSSVRYTDPENIPQVVRCYLRDPLSILRSFRNTQTRDQSFIEIEGESKRLCVLAFVPHTSK